MNLLLEIKPFCPFLPPQIPIIAGELVEGCDYLAMNRSIGLFLQLSDPDS
jgi:hypothetical protein